MILSLRKTPGAGPRTTARQRIRSDSRAEVPSSRRATAVPGRGFPRRGAVTPFREKGPPSLEEPSLRGQEFPFPAGSAGKRVPFPERRGPVGDENLSWLWSEKLLAVFTAGGRWTVTRESIPVEARRWPAVPALGGHGGTPASSFGVEVGDGRTFGATLGLVLRPLPTGAQSH